MPKPDPTTGHTPTLASLRDLYVKEETRVALTRGRFRTGDEQMYAEEFDRSVTAAAVEKFIEVVTEFRRTYTEATVEELLAARRGLEELLKHVVALSDGAE